MQEAPRAVQAGVVMVGVLGAAALAVYVAHATIGLGGPAVEILVRDWVYTGVVVCGALLCLARALLVRAERAAWALLGVALVAWTAGELYYVLVLADREVVASPSLSDLLYLSFYPAACAALALLVRARVSGFTVAIWLDGVVAALAVAAIATAFAVGDLISATAADPAALVVDLAYPLLDLVLLTVVSAVFLFTGLRPGRTFALLGAGLLLAAGGDVAFLRLASVDLYVEGGLLDALWAGATLLLGLAAWQPRRRRPATGLDGWRLLAIPAVFVPLALGMVLVDHFGRLDDLAAALAALTLVAAAARTALTFGAYVRMLARTRSEALTDGLTGLGNRRRLMRDLDAALCDGESSRPHALLTFDLDGFKRYNDAFGHPAGDALLARLGGRFAHALAGHGSAYRLGGDEFSALVRIARRPLDDIVAEARAALCESGPGFHVGASEGVVALPAEAADPSTALQLADRRLYARKGGGRDRASETQQAADALLEALEACSEELRAQSEAVSALAAGAARRLGLLPAHVETTARAALLHDVGKIAVPDAVLRKPQPLEPAEWQLVREHPGVGERILSASPPLQHLAKIVRATHERWDGSGYPDGLAGEAIPIAARIIAACDAYAAMTSDQAHGAAVPQAQALAELRRRAGSQFDPQVVEALITEAGAETPQRAVVRALRPAAQPG